MQPMVPPDHSGPPTFSCGTTYTTLQMLSVGVSVIHNNALEFYRANTSRATSSICTVHEACAVYNLYLHIVLSRPAVGAINRRGQ